MSGREMEKLVRKEPIEELYNIGQELGRGRFAIVKLCTEKSTGNQYAAKYLRKRRGGKSCRDDIIVEIDIMRQAMGHHRIVTIHEVFESQREMIIIIELATGGELFRMIAVDPLPEHKTRNIVWELLDGVQHLHTLNIVHLDLKPENILLYRKGQLDIKIADFGLAMQISPGEQVKTLVGTAEYVAPEILNYEPISVQADMWSIGALTYALLTGYSPFQGETHNDTFYNVSICEYDFEDEVFDIVSQDAKDFIEELLQKRPNARLTANQCLQHPWMQSVTATPLPNPQTQVHEGLNSSTSSLDSAMCLESLSSLEPSPISSASSSFAPRPNGKGGQEEEQCSVKQQEDMTLVVSKLCTEMQKAKNDSGAPPTNPNCDGSESSIGSNDSCNTLKPDEEDGGVFIPKSTTPPPPFSTGSKRSGSSSSSYVEEDGRSFSRPSSGLRVTTPIQSDVVSYAPETLEKLKKLEMLKKRKELEKEKEMKEKGTDRKFSLPTTSTFSRLKISSFKLKSHSELPEDKLKKKPSSPIATPKQPSPVTVKDEEQKERVTNRRLSPVPTRNQQSPVPMRNQQSPVPMRNQQSPVPMRNQQSPIPDLKLNSVDKVTTTNDTKTGSKTPETSPTLTSTSKSVSPQFTHKSSPSPNTTPTKSSPLSPSTPSSSSPVTPSGRVSPPNNNRGKSFSPQAVTKPTHSALRHTKSSSPGTSSVLLRNKTAKQPPTRDSWRKTPFIDPDAIQAILSGDIDSSYLSNLETCKEEGEEPVVPRPPVADSEKKTHLTKFEETSPILKNSGHSDSDISPRVVHRKTVTINTTRRTAKHQSVYFGSPERSPGPKDFSPKSYRVAGLQRSLTLSHSSPDLSALQGISKSRTKKPKREDSYVTGSGTPKDSNRRSFFGGLSRSLTISAKGTKKSPAHIREKYRKKIKDDENC